MKLFLVLLANLVVFWATAQVSGTIKDADGKPVNGVTVSLMKDAAVIKLSATKDNGTFAFSGIKPGTYKLSASHVGFTPFVSAAIEVNGTEVIVPEIRLVKQVSSVQGVTVTARKPIIEMKADKTILNVEGTVNAIGSDALDLLRKAPGVQVDKDDNLSISGKNGVQVYIDGRPSPLAGADLANYLKTMQSSQIEAIEIITNPSAKYEAAGNAGIINIKLKKNKNFGTNGSVNAGWNIGTYAKYNTGLSLNHRDKNVNIYGNYNFHTSTNESGMSIQRHLLDTMFNQKGTMSFKNTAHNFKGGLDITLNKRSSLGAMVNGNIADPKMSNYSRTPIVYKPTNVVNRILVADNSSENDRENLNFNLNYNVTGSHGSNLTINADHGYYRIFSDQHQPNVYYDATEQNTLSSVAYQMITPTKINISSFKYDYERDLWKGKISWGGKSANIKTDNDFQRYDLLASGKQLDKDRSNRFKYKEQIHANYLNYNRAFKGGMFQVGVRVENTTSEGTSTGLKHDGTGYVQSTSTFKRKYTDVFPSAAVTLNKNPMKQWSFTYSRRIDRPAYQDLNPFEFKLDEYTFMKGNTELRPQYTNSFGITHTYKYKLNVTANYSHVNDIFAQVIDTTERSKSFVSKKNLAKQDVISLNVSYPIMYKAFSSFINLNTNYSMYNANLGAGRVIDINAFALGIFAQNSYKFGKAKAWTAEMTAMFNAPTVMMGTFKTKAMGGIDLGMQKQVMKGKATVKASVSDVFRTMRFKGSTDFAGQKTYINSNWESRQFKLSLNWRFGNSQVKAAKQKSTGAEDENKRVQGGGGIGIGQ